MANKIALEVNERSFKKAEQAHNEYNTAKEQLITLIDSYGVKGKDLIKSEKIYKETAEAIYTLLAKDSTLPEGINKLKFLELMDVDLMPLSKGVNQLNILSKHSKKPSKEHFTTYLNEDNKEAYEALNEAVKVLNKLDSKGYIKSKIAIQNAFGSRISIDMLTTKFKFNSLNR